MKQNTLISNIVKIESKEKEILKNRVKFCRIVRKKEFGKYTFYVQFILFGKPVIRTKSPLNATVGIDIGLTTIALSSHYETELLEIAADICVFTNRNIIVETLGGKSFE